MVIKYKAKYIRNGQVVIDDSSLIELATSTSINDIARSSLPENNIVNDKAGTDKDNAATDNADVSSEERDTKSDSDTQPTPTEP